MDRCGVEMMISSGHTALADMMRGNAEMVEITARYPGRWYAYLTYNPNHPERGRAQLDSYDRYPTYVGIKFHPSGHSYPITGDAYRPALEFAAARQLIVLTHTWGGSAYDSPALLAQVAERYPQVTFLAGHSGHGPVRGDDGRGAALSQRLPGADRRLCRARADRGDGRTRWARTRSCWATTCPGSTRTMPSAAW